MEEKKVKAGYKTTEFWLTTVAAILGLLFASGAVEAGTAFDKVLGLVSMVLGSLGYAVSRGIAKK